MNEGEVQQQFRTYVKKEMAKFENRIDERLQKINQRTWTILWALIGGFGILLISLLSIIVPLLNQLLKA